MDYLVRLKPFDSRRGHVLRRYTYAGVKFQEDRGWYRVSRDMAAYLRTVRQVAGDPYSPLAFDVCTPDEARALEASEQEAANPRRAATDRIELSVAREPTGGRQATAYDATESVAATRERSAAATPEHEPSEQAAPRPATRERRAAADSGATHEHEHSEQMPPREPGSASTTREIGAQAIPRPATREHAAAADSASSPRAPAPGSTDGTPHDGPPRGGADRVQPARDDPEPGVAKRDAPAARARSK